MVRGTKPGDTVEVWFESKKAKSDSFTYTAAVESRNKVLILSAEDYTGASPAIPGLTEPLYLSYYQDALAANGIGYDVYDVDANGRDGTVGARRPRPLQGRRLVHGRGHHHEGARLGRREHVPHSPQTRC